MIVEILTIKALFLFILALYVGWNIGANDAANCIGPAIGANVISLRKGILLVAIFALAGAALQGHQTMNTMSNLGEIANLDIALIAALLGASLTITVLTFKGIPVSTTFSVVGAVTGLSLFLNLAVSWGITAKILGFGLGTPIFAAILGFITHKIISRLFKMKYLLLLNEGVEYFLILGGVFMAYSLGANNVGNSMGLIASRGIVLPIMAGGIGGFAIATGTISFGGKVVKTVGSKISMLDPLSAFSASVAGAIALYSLTMIGIPSSSSFAVVGAVAGVGLTHGTMVVNQKTIKRILINWVTCPIIAAIVSIGLFLGMKAFI